jgi:putative ABC transport system permease protein
VLSSAQAATARQQVDAIAGALQATSVLPLTGAVDPDTPVNPDGRPPVMLAKPRPSGVGEPGSVMYGSDDAIQVFVATPELLAHYRIDPASVDSAAEVLTSRASVDGYDLIPVRRRGWQPAVQHVALPGYSSLPTTLITTHAMTPLHLTPVPVGWLVAAPHSLSPAQVDKAQQTAAAAGLYIESRPTGADQARLADGFTVAGIVVALGVLAMTVGLIRSETAGDLRTLTATGARRRTRRALTAATAAALALAGAVIGTGCAYLALLAWYHRDMHWLAHPPVRNLAAILVGLPIVAYVGGWLMAGKEPPAVARQPLD